MVIDTCRITGYDAGHINVDAKINIIKHTRIEQRQNRDGRIREATVTTWDVVSEGRLISEHRTKREAKAFIANDCMPTLDPAVADSLRPR